MDIKEIYRLWDRFDGSDVTELELEINQARLVLRRETTINETPRRETTVKETANVVELSSVEKITAPLVGTYYCAASPEAEPFVTIGKEVKKGDVVAIVEAMKLMNEIVAPADGVITEIFAQDGSLVEYDETLMIMEAKQC